jgi:hypothetical protein
MTPGLCIWEMHAVILLIIHEDLTKYCINMSETVILATSVAKEKHMVERGEANAEISENRADQSYFYISYRRLFFS